MKHLLLTTIAAVVLVGCGTTQQVTVQAPDISINDAAAKGNIEAFKQHLAAGTDVDVKGGWLGGTPLHYAARDSHKEIIELLIAKGADLNARMGEGLTPLHQAAYGGHKEAVELLIAAGADVNAKDRGGVTPLHQVAFFASPLFNHQAASNGRKEVVELLIAKGADLNAKIESAGILKGYTPLDVAEEFNLPKLASILRKHGGKTGVELKAEGK